MRCFHTSRHTCKSIQGSDSHCGIRRNFLIPLCLLLNGTELCICDKTLQSNVFLVAMNNHLTFYVAYQTSTIFGFKKMPQMTLLYNIWSNIWPNNKDAIIRRFTFKVLSYLIKFSSIWSCAWLLRHTNLSGGKSLIIIWLIWHQTFANIDVKHSLHSH